MRHRLAGMLSILLMSLLIGCGRMPGLPAQGAAELARAKGVPGAEQPFPKGFLWGVATAGYQYEGHDTTSNWAAWETAGRAKEKSGPAIDHYHRFAEDLELARGMGLNAFRMSLEWSRIEPQRGQIDPEAVAHYHAVIDNALARGLTPVVTLSHFSYPAWLDAPLGGGPGGWQSAETLVEFRRFVALAAREYGGKVRYWITLNEPNTLAINGYLLGIFPPGKRNPMAYREVLDRMIQAHRLAYAELHAVRPDARVSLNPFVFTQRSSSEAEGFNPDDTALLDGAMGRGASASPTLDYVAFDYYYPVSPGDLPKIPHHDRWSVYPEGMYWVCKELYARYRLPLFVAENGMATDGDRPRPDHWTRSAFIVNHLAQLRRAMAEGIPVLGYMHWSLADNYEWGSFAPRFGLFAIDRRDTSLTRLRTEAVDTYQAIATANGLTPGLLDRYLGKRQ